MKLKVVHNSIDYTQKMGDFNNSVTTFNLSTHPLYIGLHKPLKALYVEMTTRVATDTLSLQIYNGTTFVDGDGVEDDTFGLTRSGFIKFTEDVDHDQEKTTIAGAELYWVKLTTTGAPSSVAIHGINLVLSNDLDFGFIPNVTDYLPENKTSFIAYHQEARDLIVQSLRSSGKQIVRQDEVGGQQRLNARQVDVFDLLEIEEFRNASKYLALSLLFEYLSKSEDDHFAIKAKRYHDRHVENLNSRLFSVDLDDDGVTDSEEAAAVQFIRIRRE
jgi:hypothetical protein